MTPPRIALLGGGVIGSGWAACGLAQGAEVVVYDPLPDSTADLRARVEQAMPALLSLGGDMSGWESRLSTAPSIEAAVADADFVQENGPERSDVKAELIASADRASPAHVVIASSSSTMMPSTLATMAPRHPERILVGHPFNPVYLLPLVEVVEGPDTSAAAVATALEFYRSLGKRPVHLRREMPGHLANRLQAALWREAYSLVETGVATVADVDAAIAHGPGLRWALLGPLVNQHLSGGSGGLAHVLAHLGPPTQKIMDDLGQPQLTAGLAARLVRGVDDELAGIDQSALTTARDQLLVELLTAKAARPTLP